jgi:hypothetical protein
MYIFDIQMKIKYVSVQLWLKICLTTNFNLDICPLMYIFKQIRLNITWFTFCTLGFYKHNNEYIHNVFYKFPYLRWNWLWEGGTYQQLPTLNYYLSTCLVSWRGFDWNTYPFRVCILFSSRSLAEDLIKVSIKCFFFLSLISYKDKLCFKINYTNFFAYIHYFLM